MFMLSPVRRLAIVPVLAAMVGFGATSCTRSGAEPTTITVFAAASLSASFRALEPAYEASHPGHDVELSFAGSQLLAAQLLEGAPAQVFASADSIQLDRVAAERALAGRREFASNRIVIVVPLDSPITSVFDLTAPGVRVVLAGEHVPAGRYARLALDQVSTKQPDLRSGVERNVVSNEADVGGVIAKVRLGEADAGMAYATDVVGDAKLELRELPAVAGLEARYELAVLTDERDPSRRAAAQQFVEFVSSPAGQAILAEHGFGPPPA